LGGGGYAVAAARLGGKYIRACAVATASRACCSVVQQLSLAVSII